MSCKRHSHVPENHLEFKTIHSTTISTVVTNETAAWEVAKHVHIPDIPVQNSTVIIFYFIHSNTNQTLKNTYYVSAYSDTYYCNIFYTVTQYLQG